jgi:hypothetical protein
VRRSWWWRWIGRTGRPAADWDDLSDSAETATYRVALADDKQACIDGQSEANAIGEQRDVFADTPWIPGELKELFEVGLGYGGYPEHPEDVYRSSSTSTPETAARNGKVRQLRLPPDMPIHAHITPTAIAARMTRICSRARDQHPNQSRSM